MKKENRAPIHEQKILEDPQQYTWFAQISNIVRLKRKLPEDFSVWPLQEKNKPELSELYSTSYSRKIVKSLVEAQKEMDRVFQNEYGLLDFSASFNVMHKNMIVASIITVKQAPWDDTPSGPFIIELMVKPYHRRLGIAEYLLRHIAVNLADSGAKTIALRVMSDNIKALKLYSKCGFVSWDSALEVV